MLSVPSTPTFVNNDSAKRELQGREIYFASSCRKMNVGSDSWLERPFAAPPYGANTMQVQKIVTFLWFDRQAEEAARFYTATFPNSRLVQVTAMTVTFELEGQRFIGLNGGPMFKFNEAISLFVSCEAQEEVDRLWERLTSEGGSPSRCGWLKDKFGLSWQIIPKQLMELMSDPDPQKSGRVVQAMMGMNKINIAELERAHRGE